MDEGLRSELSKQGIFTTKLAELYNCPIWMSRQEIDASGFDARQLIAIDETPWNHSHRRNYGTTLRRLSRNPFSFRKSLRNHGNSRN